ncbi:ABC transporter substrate-binding protein [Bacillus horti]|uniref:Iron complex transport system substrate-binding protein n=1 Tax=Caldalkalibacillus horti TaxID=77523 RepID=A0ABT9VTZ9_9BACI|nr:helical backbone metal receptor [Bacillus horti]MDQ0164459.1 iron complex transport system substrate-binding protein [Bacillus horti]
MESWKLWKKWGLLSLVLIVCLTLGLVACGTDNADPAPQGNQEEIEGEEAPSTEGEAEGEEAGDNEPSFPITITDGLGNEITIEEQPETIASVFPSNTEMVYALGLGEKVVGVSVWCNFPVETQDVAKIGDMEMNEEEILLLSPDLLLISQSQYNQQVEAVQRFEEVGIHVIAVQDASSFADVYDTFRLIGQATGAVTEAEDIIAEMEERLAAVKEKAEAVTEPKRVWIEVSPSPDIFTTGKNTFMDEMLQVIQAVNIAGEHEGWVSLTEEEIIQLNPDVIIATYGSYMDVEEEVMNRSGWGEVPAVKNEQVFEVDEDTVTRSGPRLIDGVETLAKHIYPEIFE